MTVPTTRKNQQRTKAKSKPLPIGVLAGPRGWGSTSQHQTALPYFVELIKGLEASGYIEPTREQMRELYDVPQERAERKPVKRRADATIPSNFTLGISVFVAQSIGAAIISRIVDEVWDAKVAPMLRKIHRSRNAQQARITRGGVRFELWFGVERVGIVVMSDDADPADVSTLVPEAVRRAEAWLNDKGVTHRYLTYRIRNGEVAAVPILSDEEP